MTAPRRLIVGITGATGTVFGVRLLQLLKDTDVETHLVISRWGARTLVHETPFTAEEVRRLATRSYAEGDQGAAISSGSFVTMGMVVLPCSMKTLAAIAHGQRRLVLGVREAPLSTIHLENMLKLSKMGVVISPPVPAFYTHPRTLDEMVDHTVARVLDLFDVHLEGADRWSGTMTAGGKAVAPPQPTPLAAAPRRPRRGGR